MSRKLRTNTQSDTTWVPVTEIDHKTLLAELALVLEDSLFRRSARYSDFLKYVVEKTLRGEADNLKERTIGIEVFHREIDYDTNADPVVRFCAAEVRKRLAQYYRGPHATSLEIELPTGSYVPQFHLRPVEPITAPPPSGQSDQLLDLEIPSPDHHVDEALLETTSTKRRSRQTIWTFAGAVLLLIGAGTLLVSQLRRPDPVEAVWGTFLKSSSHVQICTGAPRPEGGPLPDNPYLSIKDHFAQPGHKISFATASAIAELSAFLLSHKKHYTLTESDATTVDNLRNNPLILVNANNNQWTLFLAKPLRFHFQSEGDTGYIVDSDHPERRDWKVDFTKPYLDQNVDYALVARFADPTTHAPVLIVAGIGSNGTEAAADFMTSPGLLADLAQRAPKGWETMNFEVVLKVSVVEGRLGTEQISATYFW